MLRHACAHVLSKRPLKKSIGLQDVPSCAGQDGGFFHIASGMLQQELQSVHNRLHVRIVRGPEPNSRFSSLLLPLSKPPSMAVLKNWSTPDHVNFPEDEYFVLATCLESDHYERSDDHVHKPVGSGNVEPHFCEGWVQLGQVAQFFKKHWIAKMLSDSVPKINFPHIPWRWFCPCAIFEYLCLIFFKAFHKLIHGFCEGQVPAQIKYILLL